jgi:hypothetical protein
LTKLGGDLLGKELHEKEKKLIGFIRSLKFGELTIRVQDGLPVMVEKSTVKIKL